MNCNFRGAETQYLNIDLDIASQEGMDILVRFFQNHTLKLRQSEHAASFEALKYFNNIDDSANEFVRIISLMESSQKLAWAKCDYRILNAGIQAGSLPHAKEFEIKKETLYSMLKVGLSLKITIYSPIEIR